MLTINDLKQEVGRLNSELEGMTKYMRMLIYGYDKLDDILSMGKLAKNKKNLDILAYHQPQILCLFLLHINMKLRCMV